MITSSFPPPQTTFRIGQRFQLTGLTSAAIPVFYPVIPTPYPVITASYPVIPAPYLVIPTPHPVIPAQAGISLARRDGRITACAATTIIIPHPGCHHRRALRRRLRQLARVDISPVIPAPYLVIPTPHPVIPAQAGISLARRDGRITACAATTIIIPPPPITLPLIKETSPDENRRMRQICPRRLPHPV